MHRGFQDLGYDLSIDFSGLYSRIVVLRKALDRLQQEANAYPWIGQIKDALHFQQDQNTQDQLQVPNPILWRTAIADYGHIG